MGDTPRFGLMYFGEDVEGSFTEDGSKYTYGDRLTIDRLLAAVEAHNHAKPVPMPVPVDTPAAVMTMDGSLPGGRTYYYGVTFVDEYGLETSVGPLVEVSTPDVLEAPEAPQAETTSDGILQVGTYLYALTALRDEEESVLGDAVSTQVTTGQQTVLLTLPDYGDADSFRVWRLGPGEPGYTKVGLVTGSPTYSDDGSVPPDPCSCDPGNLPPSDNDGVALYAFTITLGTTDATMLGGGLISGWRLYRSEEAGVWPASALVHYVVERTTEGDPIAPLVTVWKDDGDETNIAAPPLRNQSPTFQPLSIPSGTSLPNPAGYEEGYPFLLVVNGQPMLFVVTGGTWVPVGTGGGGGGGTSVPAPSTAPDGTRWVESVAVDGSKVSTETDMPGPPGPPAVVSSVPLTWTPPGFDGGLPVTGYLVRAYDSAARSMLDVELSSDTTYYDVPVGVTSVALMAKNAVGFGQAAEVELVVDVAVPEWFDNGHASSADPTTDSKTIVNGTASGGGWSNVVNRLGDFQVLIYAWNGNANVTPFPAIPGFTLEQTHVHTGNTMSVGYYTRTVADVGDIVVPGRPAGQWMAHVRSYTDVSDATFDHVNMDSYDSPTFTTDKKLIVTRAAMTSGGNLYFTDTALKDAPTTFSQWNNVGLAAAEDAPVGGVALARNVYKQPAGTTVTALMMVTVELS